MDPATMRKILTGKSSWDDDFGGENGGGNDAPAASDPPEEEEADDPNDMSIPIDTKKLMR